jgi:hypothetical protein
VVKNKVTQLGLKSNMISALYFSTTNSFTGQQ